MSVRKKLISNTTYLFLDWFTVTLLGFFYWFIAGKTLQPEEYGIVSTVVNFAIFLSTLSLLGINTALWKLISENEAKKDVGKIKSLIKFSYQIILLTNLLILTLFLFFNDFIASTLKIPQTASILIPFATLSLTLASLSGSIIYAFQKMKLYFLTDIFGVLVKDILAIFLIFLGFRYFGLITGFIVCYYLIFILRIISIRLKGKYSKIDKKEILFEYALPAFISSLAWSIFSSGQYALLSIIQDTKATGIYTVALIMTIPIIALPNTLSSALLPIVSSLSTNTKTKSQQKRLIELVARYSFFFSLPTALFLIIFSKQVIVIFSSEKYLEASSLFPILAIASVIYGLGNLFLSNLYAIGKTKLNRNIVLLTVAIFLTLVYPLTKIYSAIGMSISYFTSILVLSIISYSYIKKFLRVEMPKKDFTKILISSLISFVFLYLTTKITYGILIDFILIAFAGAIYLFTLALLKFYKREDVKILEFFEERTPFLKKSIRNLKNFLEKFIE
ncbi:MAG: oligosaccharide flippase family protein [Candidatus Aenigmarchaeota archaeon]|jgi:O-antigen/teichoic acid export membrane protein|nr:oligosaccharide flippase family protein [Candidatus Aenigmarchaeota archaeon]